MRLGSFNASGMLKIDVMQVGEGGEVTARGDAVSEGSEGMGLRKVQLESK